MKKLAVAVLLSAAIAAPAVASDMYVGVNIGSAEIDLPGASSTTSIALLGGYTFNKNFAAEIAYTDFGSHDYGGGLTLKSSGLSISGVGSYPINEQFSLFAKLGFASTTLDPSGSPTEDDTDMTYGIGGQFDVNKQVGIRFGYDVYKVGASPSYDEKVMSVGGVFKF
ncbi:MAG: outer membrane beta-barrel protein [Gallionella sp.]